jgi:hypothetical protein
MRARFLAFAACVVMLAPAARAEGPPPPRAEDVPSKDTPACENDAAKDGYCVRDCKDWVDDYQHNGLQVIEEALADVQSCLVDGGLDPAMGQDVLRHLKSAGGQPWTLQCALLAGDAAKAGAVTNYERRLVLIGDLELHIIFHELLHVADSPTGGGELPFKYITTMDRHHSGFGNPDPVYGCQFACFPELMHEKRKYWGGNTTSTRAIEVSEKELAPFAKLFPDDCGEDGGPACAELKKYAYLCHAGASPRWKHIPGVH